MSNPTSPVSAGFAVARRKVASDAFRAVRRAAFGSVIATAMASGAAYAQFERPAAAEPPPVPAVLQPYSAALDYVGRFGGLDLWAMKDGPVFAATPDGKRAIMGAAIDQIDGGLRDATPGYTGAAAVPVAKLLSSALGERFAAARRAEQGGQPTVPSAMAQSVLAPPPAPQHVVSAQALASRPEAAPAGGKAAQVGEKAAPAGENRVIVTSASGARETIARALGLSPNDPKVSELMATAGVRDAPTQPLSVEAPSSGAPAAAAPVVKPSVGGDRVAEIAERAIYDISHRGAWIAVGARGGDVPVVYAFIDPVCPHCAVSIARLKPAIDQGRLALRVLLTPYINADSFGVSTAIMRSPDPGRALLDHEVARAAGQTGLAPLDPTGKHADGSTNLDARGLAAIQRNIDLFSQENLTGTPTWVWREKDGVRAVYGEVQANAFDRAVADSGAPVDLAFTPSKPVGTEVGKP